MRRESDAEAMVNIFSRLPWWACIILAVISYFVMDHFSIKFDQPVDTTGFQVGTMGAFVKKQMWKTLAWYGKFLFPFIFGAAAIISVVKSIDKENRVKRGMVAIIGFIILFMSLNALLDYNQPQKVAIPDITKHQEKEKINTPPNINSNISATSTYKEAEKPTKRTISRQAIYSWTNKEGNRVHSNTGFPKDETYSNPRIDYH